VLYCLSPHSVCHRVIGTLLKDPNRYSRPDVAVQEATLNCESHAGLGLPQFSCGIMRY
jgi:hypothetical protein